MCRCGSLFVVFGSLRRDVAGVDEFNPAILAGLSDVGIMRSWPPVRSRAAAHRAAGLDRS